MQAQTAPANEFVFKVEAIKHMLERSKFEKWLEAQSEWTTFIGASAARCPIACYLRSIFPDVYVEVFGVRSGHDGQVFMLLPAWAMKFSMAVASMGTITKFEAIKAIART